MKVKFTYTKATISLIDKTAPKHSSDFTIDIPTRIGLDGAQGPQGNTGATGDQGPQGDTGATGKTGLSAYDLAVAGGYTGTQEEFATEAAALANNSARLTATETGLTATKAKVSQLETKTPNTLYVILTQSTTDNLSYSFTRESFDSVASAYANGATIFVDVADNRAAAYKTIDLSKRYDALWNKTLKQVEVTSSGIARGFYIEGTTTRSRGAVSDNTMLYMRRDPALVFNPVSGFYEYNELTDITESQMADIYTYTADFGLVGDNTLRCFYRQVRTNYRPFTNWNGGISYTLSSCFYNTTMEVINLSQIRQFNVYTDMIINNGGLGSAFYFNHSLRKIIGVIRISAVYTAITSQDFKSRTLQEVSLKGLGVNANMTETPMLSRASVMYMVGNAINTSPITISLHPDAQARLTPEDIALASARNITIA